MMGTEDPEYDDTDMTQAEFEAALEAARQWHKDHPPRKVEDADTGEYL